MDWLLFALRCKTRNRCFLVMGDNGGRAPIPDERDIEFAVVIIDFIASAPTPPSAMDASSALELYAFILSKPHSDKALYPISIPKLFQSIFEFESCITMFPTAAQKDATAIFTSFQSNAAPVNSAKPETAPANSEFEIISPADPPFR